MFCELKKLFIIFLTVVMIAIGISGCEEGPMEKAGKKIDKAVEDAGEAVEDTIKKHTKKK